MRLVLRLVIGGVELVATCLEASFHDGEVLIRQGEVHHDVGLIAAQEFDELLHAVGIDLRRLDLRAILLVKNFSQHDTFLLCAAGNHYFRECVRILTHLVSCNGGYAASSYNQYSSHCLCRFVISACKYMKKGSKRQDFEPFSFSLIEIGFVYFLRSRRQDLQSRRHVDLRRSFREDRLRSYGVLRLPDDAATAHDCRPDRAED